MLSIPQHPSLAAAGIVLNVKVEWEPRPPETDIQLYLYGQAISDAVCPRSLETCPLAITGSWTPFLHPRELSYAYKAADEKVYAYIRNRGPKDALFQLSWTYCYP
jgi:hypothetical protein